MKAAADERVERKDRIPPFNLELLIRSGEWRMDGWNDMTGTRA